jgi:AraC-like DNA-binding protein
MAMIYNYEDLTFQILSAFRFKHADGFFRVNPRPYAALSLRLAGRTDFSIAGKCFCAKAGDIVYIPADTPYEVEYAGSEIAVIHLRDCNYWESEIFHPQNAAPLCVRFLELLANFCDHGAVNKVKAELYMILDAMAQDEKTAKQNSAVENCLSYLEARCCDSHLTIGAVAAKGFMSQSTLQRAFQERFGMSPKAYLCKLRMERAVSLLVKKEMTVKAVALACGFTDEKFFSRAFRERYGFSPSQLQRNSVD